MKRLYTMCKGVFCFVEDIHFPRKKIHYVIKFHNS